MPVNYSVIPEITISYKDKVKASERAVVKCSFSAREIFKGKFENFMQHHEEFWVMYLNRSHKVLGIYQTSKCGISHTLVDIRLILQVALKANATAIIACHNHPSGNVNPSTEDKQLTRKLKEACKTLDIELLDHLIMTAETYLSFADEGLI